MADRKPKVRLRWLPFPSEREPYEPEPMAPVTGRDGRERSGDYLRRSVGLPARLAVDDDYGVRWTPWPLPS